MADTPTIEARRATVASGLVTRKPYRQLAEDLGVSASLIMKEVKAPRREWAKERGQTDEIFEQSLSDLDTWEGQLMADLPSLPVEKWSGTIDTLLRLNDQRLNLHGLYPKAGMMAEGIPNGTIRLKISVIPSGNRQLIDVSDEEEYREDSIDAGDVEYGKKIRGAI